MAGPDRRTTETTSNQAGDLVRRRFRGSIITATSATVAGRRAGSALRRVSARGASRRPV
ncbi:hypothetical protein Cus16_0377 [Curtobacterium sp. ER1/6]|nr:hypothetical protein Cus16_0377 [Curtobacterium sp. ER1/6]